MVTEILREGRTDMILLHIIDILQLAAKVPNQKIVINLPSYEKLHSTVELKRKKHRQTDNLLLLFEDVHLLK